MSESLRILFGFGRFFSPFYSFAMSMRAAFYKKGVFSQHTLPVPVISVGNLTLGGTGKTPMTLFLAKLVAAYKPVIVSRGYAGGAKGEVNVVSDHHNILMDARNAGDEPYCLAQSLPGVPVLTSKKRIQGGQYAVDYLQAGSVILDDGFQHLALHRDVNIALFKVDSFLGNNRVFPGGDMREPLKALNRADCFVLTCVDDDNRARAEAIRKALLGKFPDIPVFMAEYKAVSLTMGEGSDIPVSDMTDSLFGFCGLAYPASFQKSLKLAGLTTVGFQGFKDHCPYFAPELKFLKKQIANCEGVQGLITTEKDMVKLTGKDLGLPLYALRMEMVPEESLSDFVLKKLSALVVP
ncbi:MAG: tetraacyldisaccharide 4'-kinase [Desulfobulbaceae bacterium]|nr:tetraacyldisaccharide 4'-kinase [Desulfobulbaceae bacterium]